MANSLRNKIKHFFYTGEFTESERNRLLNALDDTELKQKPCEDCINRQAVKKLKKYNLNYDTNTTIPKTDIFVKIADIEELPPVTPKVESEEQ